MLARVSAHAKKGACTGYEWEVDRPAVQLDCSYVPKYLAEDKLSLEKETIIVDFQLFLQIIKNTIVRT